MPKNDSNECPPKIQNESFQTKRYFNEGILKSFLPISSLIILFRELRMEQFTQVKKIHFCHTKVIDFFKYGIWQFKLMIDFFSYYPELRNCVHFTQNVLWMYQKRNNFNQYPQKIKKVFFHPFSARLQVWTEHFFWRLLRESGGGGALMGGEGSPYTLLGRIDPLAPPTALTFTGWGDW